MYYSRGARDMSNRLAGAAICLSVSDREIGLLLSRVLSFWPTGAIFWRQRAKSSIFALALPVDLEVLVHQRQAAIRRGGDLVGRFAISTIASRLKKSQTIVSLPSPSVSPESLPRGMAGRAMVKVVPSEVLDSTSIVPWCSLTTFFATARPRPVPFWPFDE